MFNFKLNGKVSLAMGASENAEKFERRNNLAAGSWEGGLRRVQWLSWKTKFFKTFLDFIKIAELKTLGSFSKNG